MFCLKKTVYLVKNLCMKISLSAFRTNFCFHILNYVQFTMKPVLPLYFLFYCLTSTKFANHVSSDSISLSQLIEPFSLQYIMLFLPSQQSVFNNPPTSLNHCVSNTSFFVYKHLFSIISCYSNSELPGVLDYIIYYPTYICIGLLYRHLHLSILASIFCKFFQRLPAVHSRTTALHKNVSNLSVVAVLLCPRRYVAKIILD